MASSIPLLSFLIFSILLLFSLSCSCADKTQSCKNKKCSPLEDAACSLPSSTGKSLTDLDSIRDRLIGLEDEIVSCLIERSKYTYDPQLYHEQFQLFLNETEAVEAKFGRYILEEENPFTNVILPGSELRKSPKCTQVLHQPASCFNINNQIKKAYLGLLPIITTNADEENYVATLAIDVACLQSLSRRIHYGKFVAEAKYTNKTKDYDQAIHANNTTALTDLLTDTKVEAAVVRRVELKAMIFGQNITLNYTCGAHQTYKVKPNVISGFYNQSVIPLTKDVEIKYLLHRLEREF